MQKIIAARVNLVLAVVMERVKVRRCLMRECRLIY